MPTPTSTAAPARLTLTVTSHKTGVTAAAAVTTADIRVGTFLLTVTTSVGPRAPRTGRFLCSATSVVYLGGERLVTLAGGRLDDVDLEGEALAEDAPGRVLLNSAWGTGYRTRVEALAQAGFVVG